MADEKEQPPKPQNILKTRDDHRPVCFDAIEGKDETFKICQGVKSSWVEAGQEIGFKELRSRIEPWLTALFQSEHLSFLAGSGLTHAMHKITTDSLAAGMERKNYNLGELYERICSAADTAAKRAGRTTANIEDDLRVANELLRGLEIIDEADKEKTEQLRTEIINILGTFSKSILQNETNIAQADENKREQAFNILVTFLMSFASRTGTRDRLNIFTTNYDRLIEAGAEIAGLHLLDRFLGTLMPIFRSSRLDLDMHYNPPGIRGEPRYLEGVARFTKLHGSVDWVQADKDIRRIGLPFGAADVAPFLNTPGLKGSSAHDLMIYPNSAKDRETSEYPYVELFRDFAAAVCRPNSALVTYGYSFGDEHINRVIRDMLTIPSTHLVIISYNDPLGRIMETYEELGRPSQISLMIGPTLSDLQILTENFLPKAAIDKTTFRMSELLNRRFGHEQTLQPPENGDDLPDGMEILS